MSGARIVIRGEMMRPFFFLAHTCFVQVCIYLIDSSIEGVFAHMFVCVYVCVCACVKDGFVRDRE